MNYFVYCLKLEIYCGLGKIFKDMSKTWLLQLPILFIITTILELSHFENSFCTKFKIEQISRGYRDNFGICK